MTTLPIYIGYDPRAPVQYHVLVESIIKNSSKPVAITPLRLSTLPIGRAGLTEFTFTRFLCPWLQDYRGFALFLDSDMLVLGDVAELFQTAESAPDKQVHIVPNPERFEWSSVMLFNCTECQNLTPDYIETAEKLHGITEWAEPDRVGHLPLEWNHLVGYRPHRS